MIRILIEVPALAADRELMRDIHDAIARAEDRARGPVVPAGTRLSGDDALPITCSRNCAWSLTGQHHYSCAAFPAS